MAGKHTSRRSTPDAVLDAAEKVFSVQGFDGASMREIAADAGVNLPTIYYYFSSKLGLIQAVLDRRLEPIRRKSMRLLQEAEEAAGGKPLPVETILESLLRPPLRLAASGAAPHVVAMQLIGRILSEPDPRMHALLTRRHQEVRDRFLAALGRSLPHLPKPALMWRCEFTWGLLAAFLTNSRRIGREMAGACHPPNAAAVLEQVVGFLAAGFRAEAAPRPAP